MGSDVDGEILGEEFKGYTLRITGGNDKQGFTMKQGILVNGRVRILMKNSKSSYLFLFCVLHSFLELIFNSKLSIDRILIQIISLCIGTTTYRPRRTGERKRKSVRGCICGPDLAVIALKVLVKGEKDVAGLTDAERPRRLGPKRANKIRQAFVLRKTDDVTKYVVRRELKKGDKTFYKSPKVQRLITEKRYRRKVLWKKEKTNKWKANKEANVAYEKLLSKYLKEKKAAAKKEQAPATPAPAAPAKTPAKVEKKAAPKKEEKKAAPVKKEAPKKEAPKKEAAKATPAAPAKGAKKAKK